MNKILGPAIETKSNCVFYLDEPYRHTDVLLMVELAKYKQSEQGFIAYVDRKTAMKIARESGQVISKTELEELYTEDMW